MSETGKQASAAKALEFIEEGGYLGVGTGSTVNLLIPLLARKKHLIRGAVSSSEASTRLLKSHGFDVVDLGESGDLPLYIDGADEVDAKNRLIKGGGGALTREKIIAAASRKFVCIVDASKQVAVLGRFPLPIEVIPMARSFVARQLRKRGGQPVWREHIVTDNGNQIIDIHGLEISDPESLEAEINNIPGVVTVGLFALRKADVVIVDGQQRR